MKYEIKPNQRVVRVTDFEIFSNTSKYPNHRAFVQQKFEEMGYAVTVWHSTYNGEEKISQGIEYIRTDSDIQMVLEIVGTIGVNIIPLRGAINAEGNQVQTESTVTPGGAEANGNLVLQSSAGGGSGDT